jgi:hypothetical protein
LPILLPFFASCHLAHVQLTANIVLFPDNGWNQPEAWQPKFVQLKQRGRIISDIAKLFEVEWHRVCDILTFR